jgi:hypothetical protein
MLSLLIYLIFVQPKGEEYTTQEQAYSIEQVHKAVGFWGYTATIETAFITTEQDVYTLPIDSWGILPAVEGTAITIYVVDNSQSRSLYFGSYGGYAQDYYRLATGLSSTFLAATLAHELGHVLYGLPDWYRDPTLCYATDIMCDGVAAFNAGVIGCRTLDFIGRPCKKIYLPRIQT